MLSLLLLCSLFFTVVFSQGQNCVICPDDTVSLKNTEPLLFSNQISRAVSTTPTCSNTVDVALVYYPVDPAQNCVASTNQLKSYSLWFGIIYGQCSHNIFCGTNCTGLEQCGSKGYTVNEYNQCYSSLYGCGSISSSFKLEPYNATLAKATLYSGSECFGNSTGTTFITLNECQSSGSSCGYDSAAFVTVNNCPSSSSTGEPVPEVSSASALSVFF